MKSIDKLIIILHCISLTAACAALYINLRSQKRIESRLRRNEQVYKFRKWVLDNRPDLYDNLPSYDTMFKDKKPLKLETYLPHLFN